MTSALDDLQVATVDNLLVATCGQLVIAFDGVMVLCFVVHGSSGRMSLQSYAKMKADKRKRNKRRYWSRKESPIKQ